MWITNRDLDVLNNKLDKIIRKLGIIQIEGEINMALVDDVKTKVEGQVTVVGSAVTLLQELKAMLDAAGTDPVKLQAIADLLDSNTTALADAVVANTPAAA